MSAFDVAITLGPYSFTINSGDPAGDYDPVFVLDGLKIEWAKNPSDPDPAQPQPVEAELSLATRSVSNLADLERGTPAAFRLTSAGKLIAPFTGRIDDITAKPVRRYNATTGLYELWIVYKLLLSDYRVDLAELPISLTRPAETGNNRQTAIVDALVAAGSPPITTSFLGAINFDAVNLVDQSGLDLLVDHLRQLAVGANGLSRMIVLPVTAAGVLTGYLASTAATLDPEAEAWPPAKFKLVATVMGLSFTEAPPGALGGLPMGLAVDAGRVELDGVEYRLAKVGNPNVVAVSGSFGTVLLTYRPDLEPVTLALNTTMSDAFAAEFMAQLYLPISDVEPWTGDKFVWRPTDAELAAMPFPLAEDTDTGNISCYQAPVAIHRIPNNINPAGDSGFYAGTLDGATVEVRGGDVLVTLKINRRLPLPLDDVVDVGVTWDDLKASFNTVTWRTGANKIDPTLSWNDIRLARRP